jgi:hypothetical protein
VEDERLLGFVNLLEAFLAGGIDSSPDDEMEERSELYLALISEFLELYELVDHPESWVLPFLLSIADGLRSRVALATAGQGSELKGA